MNLCFICPEYPPGPHGGVGTLTQVLGRALVQRGHGVRAVGVYPKAYPASDYEEDQGVRVWRLREHRHRLGWVRARYALNRLIASWVRAGEVDLVEAPDSIGWFAGWPPMRVPLVLRSNGSYTYFAHVLGKRVDRRTFRLERWSHRRANAWAAVSHYTGSMTKKVFALANEPDSILYNPVDAPSAVPLFEGRRGGQVVFTGTLTPKKGLLPLIAAWPAVRARCENAELHLLGKDGRMGDGESMRAYLMRQLPEPLRSTVVFHDHVERHELFRFLSNARVAVFPSFAEACALAPLEAMACGCPTIFTTRTGGSEMVRHGIDGLLVDPDEPGQIADAIVTLLQDEALAKSLGEAGRKRVTSAFALERIVPLNEEFYSRAIRLFGPMQAGSLGS